LYKIHRWVAAIGGAQLLLWCGGGLIFSTHDLSWVRGVEGSDPNATKPVEVGDVGVSPSALEVDGDQAVREVRLRSLLDSSVYEVRFAEEPPQLVSAADGRRLSEIDEDTARQVARRDRLGEVQVAEATRITAEPDDEYRKKPLPAWRITLDDGEGTNVWVDATTGVITARRNDAWRRFDFFWMLHTMDYWGSDDFNTPRLIIFAVLGLLTALPGVVVWGSRLWRRRRPVGHDAA